MSRARGCRVWSASIVGFSLLVFVGSSVPAYAADAPRFYIEPIAGLTTARHLAPEVITLPKGTVLTVCHALRVSVPGSSNQDARPRNDSDITAAVESGSGSPPVVQWAIQWNGATALRNSAEMSWAERSLDTEGEFTIQASLTKENGETLDHRVRVKVVDLGMDRINLRRAAPRVDAFALDENAGNGDTMQAYFGESIAALVPVVASREAGARGTKTALSRFRTSVNRTVRFDLRTDPPGFESIMEVRAAGVDPYLAESNPQRFYVPGVHRLSVGPQRLAREVEIETYEVEITGHDAGTGLIPLGQPVTFTAVTDPPGYENEINWVSSTKFGTAVPIVGRGPTFTTRFDDAWGSFPDEPDKLTQWLGVKADNAVFGQDPPGVVNITGGAPTTGGTGTIVTITGTGFGNNPDNLCLVKMPDKLAAARVFMATDQEIKATIGGVHPDAVPGNWGVALGEGGTSTILASEIGASGLVGDIQNAWAFIGDLGPAFEDMCDTPFTPIPDPPALVYKWVPSCQVDCPLATLVQLSIGPFAPNLCASPPPFGYPTGTTILVDLHFNCPAGSHYDIFVPSITLTANLTANQVANIIAMAITQAFQNQGINNVIGSSSGATIFVDVTGCKIDGASVGGVITFSPC